VSEEQQECQYEETLKRRHLDTPCEGRQGPSGIVGSGWHANGTIRGQSGRQAARSVALWRAPIEQGQGPHPSAREHSSCGSLVRPTAAPSLLEAGARRAEGGPAARPRCPREAVGAGPARKVREDSIPRRAVRNRGSRGALADTGLFRRSEARPTAALSLPRRLRPRATASVPVVWRRSVHKWQRLRCRSKRVGAGLVMGPVMNGRRVRTGRSADRGDDAARRGGRQQSRHGRRSRRERLDRNGGHSLPSRAFHDARLRSFPASPDSAWHS